MCDAHAAPAGGAPDRQGREARSGSGRGHSAAAKTSLAARIADIAFGQPA
jgi:hypothetical protein